MDWSETDTEKLKQLVKEGFSARIISEQLGRTRNAILGRIHRLGLSRGVPTRCVTRLYRRSWWTKEGTARLKQLWCENGVTAPQIAAEFGMSLGAITSKTKRLGLVRAPRTSKPPKPKSGAPYRNPKVDRIATLIVSNAVSAPLSKALLIDALTERTCRWMDGDPKRGGTFCGHETMPGSPWCPHHYARVYYSGPLRSEDHYDRFTALRLKYGAGRDTPHVILTEEAA